MAGYRLSGNKHRLPRRVGLLLAALVILVIGGALVSTHVYRSDLQAVNNSPKSQIFTVNQGSSVRQIADSLQKDHLIRSSWAFQLYVHSKEFSSRLQAGTYALSPNQDMASIVTTLTRGRVATMLVTIYPGRRIDQVRADLINDGFAPAAVDQALDPAQYADLPALAFKPANVTTLEGLLWPDSFQKDSTTPPSYIIRESLMEAGVRLTPDVQAAFTAEGLTTYKGLILASMVEQEADKTADRAQVAQVFLSRLKAGSTLGSDVTANYGSIEAGFPPNLSYDSPYNTLKHTGLPPTPISSVSEDSLTAAAHPAGTSWLYFVTGDNGTTYFSTNLQDHQTLTQKYCHKLCNQ